MADYSNHFWQGTLTRLRGVREQDAEQAFLARLDTPSRQVLQLETEFPVTLDQMREGLARRANCQDIDGLILFAIENLQGEQAGTLSFHTRDIKNGTFSFGVSILAPHRRQGYAEDAVKILLKFAFWEQLFQKCNSSCAAENQSSIGLHQKLGFIEEGRRRRCWYHDEVLFGMTREEFDATL